MFKNDLTPLYHGAMALGLQVAATLILWLAGVLPLHLAAWTGALVAGAYFYGREHAQEERKAADRLRVEVKFLFFTHRQAYFQAYLPWTWGNGNRWDLIVPLATVTLVAIVFSL